MRIGGVEVNGPTSEVLVLPRIEGDIIIRAQAVLSMDHFHALVPEPKVPARLEKGGFKQDEKNPGYLAQLKRYSDLKWGFICIKSLEPSEIEWDTVSLDKPESWMEWGEELAKAGLSSIEIQRITACVVRANCLDENKLREARELFLHGQGAKPQKSSGQDTEPESTQSGAPVSDAE